MKRTPILAAVLALGACSSAPPAAAPANSPSLAVAPAPTPQLSGIAALQAKGSALVAKDTAAAEADAVAHNDTISEPCYPAMNTWLQTYLTPAAAAAPVAGLFSLQQRARDGVNAVSGGVKVTPAVKLACAALFMDDATFLAKFDAFIAAAVASGGTSVVPALSGAVLPLPIQPLPVPVTVQ